jgi:hypothetical protein
MLITKRLALTCFETGVLFVDDVDAPFTTHNAARTAAFLEALERISDFHDLVSFSGAVFNR